MLYGNGDMTKIASQRLTPEYETFHEKLEKKFPGYTLDDKFHVVPKTDTPRVNFA